MQGIRRAITAVKEADIVLCVQDISKALCERLDSNSPLKCTCHRPEATSVLLNKCDLVSEEEREAALSRALPVLQDRAIAISCTTKHGYDALLQHLTLRTKELCQSDNAEAALVANARHRAHLEVRSIRPRHLHNLSLNVEMRPASSVVARLLQVLRMILAELFRRFIP